MPDLEGLSFIGFSRGVPGGRSFEARNPATGETLAPRYHTASEAELERACSLAREASSALGEAPPVARGTLLRTMASGLEDAAEAIVSRAALESGLPLPRLQGELARTSGQLRLLAEVAEEGSWVDARIDTADPERKPAPRPDVRSMRRALGPVAVFGSSNFPLAFSVAGGDTAAALAAGNPVIFKAHPAHPGTSERVAEAIVAAVRACGLPAGTFSLLFDDSLGVGQALVRHAAIEAVGFTGSRAGGEALMRLAAARPGPIPVYAEMGSVNPVLVLPGALAERARTIAEGLHASFTLGVGQFCTNPGIVLLPAGAASEVFVERLVELTRGTPAGPMLTAGIGTGYARGLERLQGLGAEPLAEGRPGDVAVPGCAAVLQVDASAVLAGPGLLHEVFGPSTLLVRYGSDEELMSLLGSLEGQLTATVHAAAGELETRASLLELLSRKAGRVVFGQFPTGVEVNHAMVHGGPFPATSDGRSTSVGTRAIERFSRLVAWQNAPQEALPPELQDANPRGIRRLVNGRPATGPLGT